MSEEILTFYDFVLQLSNDTLSVWQLTKNENILPDDILTKKHNNKIEPIFNVLDLNNDKETPYKNKPKSAIQIGLKMSF